MPGAADDDSPAAPAVPDPVIPVFPLTGVLLLPRALLPLNIFEPRYLAMTRAALAGSRQIGMIQPLASHGRPGRTPPGANPDLYTVGCLGEIVSATETDDGRILITLRGLRRFRVGHEIATDTPYRQVTADYAPFDTDATAAPDGTCDRPRLLAALRAYCQRHNLPADWDSIDAAADDLLVHSLCMICPFTPGEKQALLEAPDFAARAAMLVMLLEMALLDPAGSARDGRPRTKMN